jgi:hypothetical protein
LTYSVIICGEIFLLIINLKLFTKKFLKIIACSVANLKELFPGGTSIKPIENGTSTFPTIAALCKIDAISPSKI